MSCNIISTQDIMMNVLRNFDNNEKEEKEELINDLDNTREENEMHYRDNEAELLKLEKTLKELHEREVKKESCKERFAETVIENLYSKITFLKEEVSYLREYSKVKATLANLMVENSSEQSTPVEADVDPNLSISQTHLMTSTPIPLETYFNPKDQNEHNTIFISQQVENAPENDCNASEIQLDKDFPNIYTNPLMIANPLNNDTNDEEDNTIYIPHDLSHDHVNGHEDMLLPANLPLNEIDSEKNHLLISDESLTDSDASSQRNGMLMLNDSWQTSIVAMILMCVLVMISCFLPLFLIPRN